MNKNEFLKNKKDLLKTISIIILLIFIIFSSFLSLPIFLCGTSEDFDNIKEDDLELISIKSSNGYIFINNLDYKHLGLISWEEAIEEGMCFGSGTALDPYIIANLVIDVNGSGSGIIITNSDFYFRIENCTIKNSGTGSYDAAITLFYTNYGDIRRNNLSMNNRSGIVLYRSHYNNIAENNLSCNRYSLFIRYSQNNTFSDNLISNNIIAFDLYECDNNIMSSNFLSKNVHGMMLFDSNNNIILKIKVNESYDGIIIWNSKKN
ncbi:MAG: right-handed parallel beta-helix repeat-containing protein, partial [Promethearchaeota archaeon]